MENIKDITQPKPQESKALSPLESLLSNIESKIGDSRTMDQKEAMREIYDALECEDLDRLGKLCNPENEDKLIRINSIGCINERLNGQNHPITGVPFKANEIFINPKELRLDIGVFPQFKSKFTAQLPEDLLLASDSKQFAESNKQLKEKYISDNKFANKFNEIQKVDIISGRTPNGYTWHHNECKGKMQLVDCEMHSKTAHTGGRAIWGGGSENR